MFIVQTQVTPLSTALVDNSLLFLTIPYQELTKKVIPLTRSLPLILHYTPRIQSHFHDYFSSITNLSTKSNSSLDGALLIYEKFFETILDEGVQWLEQATEDLLRIGALSGLEAVLIEKTYSCLSQIFKVLCGKILYAQESTTSKAQRKSSARKKAQQDPTHLASEDRLRTLWNLCRVHLTASAKPHVRNCVANVWAVLLRRARGQSMRNLTMVMVESLDDQDSQEGLAAALSDGLKGAPHLLHSRAPQIYTYLLSELLQPGSTRTPLIKVMILLSTSLIHHASANAMLPLHELILRLLGAEIQTAGSSKDIQPVNSESELLPRVVTPAQMAIILRIATTMMGVRKGQRIPATTTNNEKTTCLQAYLVALQKIAPLISSVQESTAELKKEFLEALTAGLVAGKVKDWLSPGIGTIQATWSSLDVSERLAWVRLLVRVGWKGIEQFILADLARYVLSALTCDGDSLLNKYCIFLISTAHVRRL